MSWEDHEPRVQSSITGCGSLRLARWWGNFTPSYAIKCLIDDPTGGISASGSVLFDFREAMVDIDFKTSEWISETMLALNRPHRDAAVFLVSNDLTFGLARMYERASQPMFERTLVTRDLGEALGFLGVNLEKFEECETLLTDMELPPIDGPDLT